MSTDASSLPFDMKTPLLNCGLVQRHELGSTFAHKIADLAGRNISELVEHHNRASALKLGLNTRHIASFEATVVGEIHDQNPNLSACPLDSRRANCSAPVFKAD